MADAALEGLNMRKDDFDSEITDLDGYGARGAYDGVEDIDDEQLLGASTLAKIREAGDDDIELDLEDDIKLVAGKIVFDDDEDNE